jgi:hypothetical protein
MTNLGIASSACLTVIIAVQSMTVILAQLPISNLTTDAFKIAHLTLSSLIMNASNAPLTVLNAQPRPNAQNANLISYIKKATVF